MIWSSPGRSLDSIILHQDPRVHRHLLSEIISHTVAYIVNIDKPQVQLQTHLSEAALQAIPSRVARASHNNIQTTLLQQQLYQPPQQHHNYLIQHLEDSIDLAHRLTGQAAFTPSDLNEMCRTSVELINKDRALHHSTTSRLGRQQPPQLSASSTSSSSAPSSYNNRGQQQQQQHSDIQMIECNHDIEGEVAHHHLPDHRHHHHQHSQPPTGYKRRIIYDLNDGSETYIDEPLHYQPAHHWHQ